MSWNYWNFKSCYEIYSHVLIFCRCPEIFEHTCRWFISAWINKYLYQLQGLDAPARVSLGPKCGSWKQAYSYCDTAEGTKQRTFSFFRSTSKSRPNNIRGGKNVRPSTKSFFDFNEIWYTGRGRWVMHDGMPYGRIQGQGQGHEPLKVWITSIFKTYLLRHLQWELASDH